MACDSCMKSAAVLICLLLLPAAMGCSRPDDRQPGPGPGAGTLPQGGGYLDAAGWEKAKAGITSIEETVKRVTDDYAGTFGLALQYREFEQFDEAIAASRTLPGKIDTFMTSAEHLKSIPNYREIDDIKDCFQKMEPFMRKSSLALEKSLVAAKGGNSKAESLYREEYRHQYRQAMALSRKMFGIFAEMLIRGSRTEYGSKAGTKRTGPEEVATFRKTAAGVTSAYNGLLSNGIPAAYRTAELKEWDRALGQVNVIYSSLQGLVMYAAKLDPGDSKELWDARTSLTTALSYRMFAMQKYKEYIQKIKTKDAPGASGVKKLHDIMKKSADDEYAKFRKLRF